MERLMTLKEVCEIFGCDDPKGRYVRNLRSKGLIEGAKFGNKLLFKESSVQRYIEKTFNAQNKRASIRDPETKDNFHS